MSAIASAAIAYAQSGLPVFPCSPEKKPLTNSGFKDASTDINQVSSWWQQCPNAMIGVPTGHASSVFVVDVDIDENHPDVDQNIEEFVQGREWPNTTWQATPSGGRHYLFRHVAGVKCSSRKFGMIDIRGDGGYIILAPSVASSGNAYALSGGLEYVLDPPPWLVETLTNPPPPTVDVVPSAPKPVFTPTANDNYGRAALESELSSLRNAHKGSRNDALNKAAFSLFQLVHAGHLSETEVMRGLEAACQANGLIGDDGQHSFNATITSAKNGAATNPREKVAAGQTDSSQQRSAVPGTHAASSMGGVPAIPANGNVAPSEPISKYHVSRWRGVEPDPLVWVMDDFIPRGMTTILCADGGAGKTLLMQMLLTAVSVQAPWCDRQPGMPRAKAIGLFAEDPENILHIRQRRIEKAMGVSAIREEGEDVFIRSLTDRDATLWDMNGPTQLFTEVEADLATMENVGVLAVDNAAIVYADDENHRHKVTSFIRHLTMLAERFDIGVVLAAHTSKGSAATKGSMAPSGSTAWPFASRSTLVLEPATKGNPAILTNTKANHAKDGQTVELEWTDDGVLLPPNPNSAKAMERKIEDHRFEVEIRRICQDRWDSGSPLSMHTLAKNTGRHFPSVVGQQLNIEPERAKKIAQRLLNEGRLESQHHKGLNANGLKVPE